MTKQQLLIHKNLTLAKGITWLTSELSDSLLFKSDDLTLSKINQLKNENQDMKYIVSCKRNHLYRRIFVPLTYPLFKLFLANRLRKTSK